MLKKTKLVSLILLSGALAVPVGAFAEIAPEKQSVSVSQQSGKVSGVVEDALGPITGATVLVKGTTNGNVTDMDGNFTLENVKRVMSFRSPTLDLLRRKSPTRDKLP